MNSNFILILESILLLYSGVLCYKYRKKISVLTKEKDEEQDFYHLILRHINAFIILADENFFVQMTNYYTKTNTIDPRTPVRIGELLRCKNGLDANHCGGHKACNLCMIRGTIQKSFQKNCSFEDVEAPMRLYLTADKKEYSDVYVTISGSVLEFNHHKHILLTINETTSRHEMQCKLKEEKLRAEESDRLKTAFLANMSHEIRTPLNAIIGFSSLLGTNSTNEEREEYLQIINSNNDQLLQLMNDIFDFAKIEAGTTKFSYSESSLNQMFNDLKQIFEPNLTAESEVQLLFKPALDNCYIRTDHDHLLRVLTNLLSNAFKFTSKGSITVGYEVQKDGIYCYVQDTGTGIAIKDSTHLFERFTKTNTNKPGTGLGLALCKKIIEKLNGKIGVVSEPGKGSKFWFTLPVQPLTDNENSILLESK